jgi:PAS domain S-box-containing protein
MFIVDKKSFTYPEVLMSVHVQKTLLLVEDEAIIAHIEKRQLEGYGYAVRLASTGEQAVQAVKTCPEIDLVLMDIDLGRGMDGTEAAELILQDHELPIVFLSSHSEREVVEKTEKITSYGYVVKNSSITVLDASIKMAFKLFQARMNEKQSKEVLRQSEERQRQITENINEVLWLTSADRSTMQYINPAYEKVWGRSCQSLYDNPRSFIDSVHEEDKAAVLSQYEKYGSGARFELEYRIVRQDGSLRWVKAETFPVKNTDGCILGEAGIAWDITGQKQAQQEAIRHRNKVEEINRIGRLACSSLDLDTVLKLILGQTVQAQGASAGMIFIIDPGAETLSWGASIGLSEAFVRDFQAAPIKMGEGLTGTIARDAKPIFIAEDSSHDPRISRPVIQQEGLNSFIGVPLLAEDEVVGVMSILTRPPLQLTQEDAGFITAIGLQVGWAIKKSRLHARQA